MYNLVLIKDGAQYITSVFDERNNEIWNNKTYADLLMPDIKQQKFSIDNIIYEDRCFFMLSELTSCFKKVPNLVNIGGLNLVEPIIANEGLFSYGFARYAHRAFLKRSVLVS